MHVSYQHKHAYRTGALCVFLWNPISVSPYQPQCRRFNVSTKNPPDSIMLLADDVDIDMFSRESHQLQGGLSREKLVCITCRYSKESKSIQGFNVKYVCYIRTVSS